MDEDTKVRARARARMTAVFSVVKSHGPIGRAGVQAALMYVMDPDLVGLYIRKLRTAGAIKVVDGRLFAAADGIDHVPLADATKWPKPGRPMGF